MGEMRQCRRIPHNSCRYFAFKEGSINPHSLGVGCTEWTSFKRTQCERGGSRESYFTVEKSDEHCLSHVIKATINSEWSYWGYVSLIWCVENVALPHIFPHKTHQSSLIMRETPGKFQSKGILQNTLENCQGHKKQGISEKLSQSRGS